MRKKFICIGYCLFCVCLSFKIQAQKKNITFTDVTAKAGINFRLNYGDNSYKNIIESSGSGITIFDYNNDGLMDLYLMNGTYLEGISDPSGKKYRNAHNELYKNNGDGTFTEVSELAGIGGHQWSMAAGAIDLDKDGFQDLYVLNYGPNVFYHNNGNGTFSDITSSLGLAGPEKLNGFISYTYARSYRTIPDINAGQQYLSPFDKPNTFDLFLNYNISKRVAISTNFRCQSGQVTTVPIYVMGLWGKTLTGYSNRNDYRLPPYQRLDISLTIKNKQTPGKRYHSEWNFSIINVLNHANIQYVNFVTSKDNPNIINAKGVSMLGFIPSVSYHFNF